MEGLERVEKLLAQILVNNMEDASQVEKAVALSRAGLGNQDIAELLGSTARSISTQLYTARKGKARKPTSKKR